jgi:WD40 repeat protein
MQILSGDLKRVDRLVFSPDGARLATAGGENNPVEVYSFDAPAAPPAVIPLLLDVNTYEFAFDPSGELLVGADDKGLVGFDPVTGKELWCNVVREFFTLGGLDVSPDGRLAFAFQYQYLMPDGYHVWELAGRKGPRRVRAMTGTPDHGCHAVRFVKDAQMIAFAEVGGGGKYQFNLLPTSGRGRGRVLESEIGELRQLVAHGNLLAALSPRLVWVWDVDNTEPLAGVAVPGRKAMTGVAFHPSGKFLAVSSNDETVTLFDTQTWQATRSFSWNVGRLRGVAFSPDGTRAAVGSHTGQIVVWDVDV